MAKKLLYAMRHCETIFNVQGKSQGWCDSPITPRGVEQCKRAGQELARRGIRFDHFYTSTSERCCDTMELVCTEAYGQVLPYTRKKGLRECGFGIFEGKDDFCEPSFGQLRSLVMEAAGGETDEQVNARMDGCISQIMADDTATNVLIVSSGGSLRHFYMMHADQNAAQGHFQNSNCMCYVYEWEDGVFRHLETYVPDYTGLDDPGIPNRWAIAPHKLEALVEG